MHSIRPASRVQIGPRRPSLHPCRVIHVRSQDRRAQIDRQLSVSRASTARRRRAATRRPEPKETSSLSALVSQWARWAVWPLRRHRAMTAAALTASTASRAGPSAAPPRTWPMRSVVGGGAQRASGSRVAEGTRTAVTTTMRRLAQRRGPRSRPRSPCLRVSLALIPRPMLPLPTTRLALAAGPAGTRNVLLCDLRLFFILFSIAILRAHAHDVYTENYGHYAASPYHIFCWIFLSPCHI